MLFANNSKKNVPLNTGKLVNDIWRDWYPHRQMDRDVADGNFFCNFATLGPSWALKEIYNFHNLLSTQVTAQQPMIKRPEIPRYTTLDVAEDVSPTVRPSFSEVFIVIDKLDWRQEGVLLTYKNETIAAKYGSNGRSPDLPVSETGGPTFRVQLEQAMQIIMFVDHERVWPNMEKSVLYKDLLRRV